MGICCHRSEGREYLWSCSREYPSDQYNETLDFQLPRATMKSYMDERKGARPGPHHRLSLFSIYYYAKWNNMGTIGDGDMAGLPKEMGIYRSYQVGVY